MRSYAIITRTERFFRGFFELIWGNLKTKSNKIIPLASVQENGGCCAVVFAVLCKFRTNVSLFWSLLAGGRCWPCATYCQSRFLGFTLLANSSSASGPQLVTRGLLSCNLSGCCICSPLPTAQGAKQDKLCFVILHAASLR